MITEEFIEELLGGRKNVSMHHRLNILMRTIDKLAQEDVIQILTYSGQELDFDTFAISVILKRGKSSMDEEGFKTLAKEVATKYFADADNSQS